MTPTRITESQYIEACEENAGFCTTCRDIVFDVFCEPDAKGYECPECGEHAVTGMEQALIEGLVTF